MDASVNNIKKKKKTKTIYKYLDDLLDLKEQAIGWSAIILTIVVLWIIFQILIK